MLSTPPDVHILVNCAKPDLGAGALLAYARDIEDWDALFDAASAHGVLPLLYWRLAESGAEGAPAAAFHRLEARFRRNAMRNLYMAAELLDILDALETAGITAVPYKGPVLAAGIYGDLALRQFSDLDLLVRSRDVARAVELLKERGYRPEVVLTSAQHEAYLRTRHCHLLVRESPWCFVEIHWRIQPRYFAFHLDADRLLERLEPTTFCGRPIRTITREDTLLLLCMHGSTHAWQRLEWIADVARLAEGGNLDWDRCLGEAGRLGARRMLHVGLILGSRLLGAALPEQIRAEADRDRTAVALAEEVTRTLCSGPLPDGSTEHRRFHLRSRERLRDRVEHVLRLALTPYVRDWAVVPLPRALGFLYYVIRPFRVLAHVAQAWSTPFRSTNGKAQTGTSR